MTLGFRAGTVAVGVSVALSAASARAETERFDARLEAARQRSERGVAAAAEPSPSIPRIAWTTRGEAPPEASATEAARHHLAAHAERHGLPASAVHSAEVREVHDTGRGGIIVRFRQRKAGHEVVGAAVSVLMTRDLDLVAVSGELHPQTGAELADPARYELGPDQAIAAAIDDRYGARVALAREEGDGTAGAYQLAPSAQSSGVYLHEPARARRVLYPLGGELVPAYALHAIASFGPSTEVDGFAYIVSAEDGQLLRRYSLTADAAFTYRVWAQDDELSTPHDGPHGTLNPHPDGEPSDLALEFIEPVDVAVEGFNSNPDGEVDPWLADGATETRGNNVDAYADHLSPDGFDDGDDLRAATTADGEFLYDFDTAAEPIDNDDQVMSAVTQLFYVNNWLHDWYYDSGFDEEAGNAQADNFGRGGEAGDRLLAEAQDTARDDEPQRNNANMLTPPDGTSPRMQMFLWDGPTDAFVEALDRELDPVGVAEFGPESFDLEADVALAEDGSTESEAGEGSVTDACQAIDTDVTDLIALVDRGGCSFVTKAQNVEDAGAAGMIVANNEGDGVVTMAEGEEPVEIAIPSLMITLDDGDELKGDLPAAARLFRDSSAPDRDGTIDNMIVAHEWGHYLHFRLVEDCGITQQCRAMSEGFSDFVALHMTIDEGDSFDDAYAVGQYASGALTDNDYYGVRRVPYSTDEAKNALTFKHIQRGVALPVSHPLRGGSPDSNFQVHSAGEVWATAMLEAYGALVRERDHTFAEAKRRMGDYLVAGMKMAPSAPTYTEQIHALLAAVWAADREDFAVMAEAFAARGMGSGAQSPPTYSADLVGVTESYDTAGEIQLIASELDDEISTCDEDGILDLTESGNLVLTLENVGYASLDSSTISLSASSPGISFPEGNSVTVDAMAPLTGQSVSIPVAADDSLSDLEALEFEVAIASADAVTPEKTVALEKRVSFDVVEGASRTDRVDSPVSSWTTEDFGVPVDLWRRVARGEDGVWQAEHVPTTTDSRLVSPELDVNGNFEVSFRHRHHFAFGPIEEGGDDIYFGGGLVEIRTAGGEWTDASQFATVGYGGSIGLEGTANPLQGRQGYVGASPGYPDFDEVTLDFGSAFVGQTVQIRFRIGAGLLVGAPGWEIDEISVSGINNAPFNRAETEGGDCASIGDPNSGCGCASTGAPPYGSALLAGLVALWLLPLRRRQRRST